MGLLFLERIQSVKIFASRAHSPGGACPAQLASGGLSRRGDARRSQGPRSYYPVTLVAVMGLRLGPRTGLSRLRMARLGCW